MTDYKKYINALRKCAKEHENDRTFTGHVVVSDLCQDTANLLETLEQEPVTIPFLMHKEMDIPISECQKAYVEVQMLKGTFPVAHGR